jgi:hypothetical protein
VDSTIWFESKHYRAVLTLITLEVLILLALGILCFAAFKIKAASFEFSTAIWKIASFSIKIRSPGSADERSDPKPSTIKAPRDHELRFLL